MMLRSCITQNLSNRYVVVCFYVTHINLHYRCVMTFQDMEADPFEIRGVLNDALHKGNTWNTIYTTIYQSGDLNFQAGPYIVLFHCHDNYLPKE